MASPRRTTEGAHSSPLLTDDEIVDVFNPHLRLIRGSEELSTSSLGTDADDLFGVPGQRTIYALAS